MANTKENNCKWHFGNEGGRDVGYNDPLETNFLKHPYISIVRESIQNSLDVVADETQPVRIEYSFERIKRSDYPALCEIETHIEECRNYYCESIKAKEKFDSMITSINDNLSTRPESDIKILKISDYNTTGMPFDKSNEVTSPFYAFLRSAGVEIKSSEGAGGAFGFGKAAYFLMSPIRSVLVSTKCQNGACYFEGAASLCTHKFKGKKVASYGLYDNNDGNPTDKADQIPEYFQRTRVGTDVFILGMLPDKKANIVRSMMTTVLNHFWLAIYEKKLIVEIDKKEIHSANLFDTMRQYFQDFSDNHPVKYVSGWNPRPYFEAVKNKNKDEDHLLIEKDLPTLGHVKLYIYRAKGLKSRIVYMRRPKMIVSKRPLNKAENMNVVFVCDNKKGNELLRRMENPAHDEWKKENATINGRIPYEIVQAEEELDNFITNELDSLLESRDNKPIELDYLLPYFGIPGDLLEKEEPLSPFDPEPEKLTAETTKETGIITPSVQLIAGTAAHRESKQPNKSLEIIKARKNDEDGNDILGAGGQKPNNDNNGNPQAGNAFQKGTLEPDETSSVKVPVDIYFRVFAQKKNGEFFNVAIIESDHNIEKAELVLKCGCDDGSKEPIAIANSDAGDCDENCIRNLSLNKGKNRICFSFADNLKHSISLEAYEIR